MVLRLPGQVCGPLSPWILMWLLSLQFLAYDTQMVLGNRRHSISPEDYITGALQIYTDIVYIFITFCVAARGEARLRSTSGLSLP